MAMGSDPRGVAVAGVLAQVATLPSEPARAGIDRHCPPSAAGKRFGWIRATFS